VKEDLKGSSSEVQCVIAFRHDAGKVRSDPRDRGKIGIKACSSADPHRFGNASVNRLSVSIFGVTSRPHSSLGFRQVWIPDITSLSNGSGHVVPLCTRFTCIHFNLSTTKRSLK
jgi:hypothetical protein